MKKVIFILTMVVLAACNSSTTTTNDPDSAACKDSCATDTCLNDSIGIKQVEQLDSLSKAGKI